MGADIINRFVTIQELVKDYCPVSEDLIRYWIRHEGLPVHRASKSLGSQKARILIHIPEFDSWMRERRKDNRDIVLNINPRAREIFEEAKQLGWE